MSRNIHHAIIVTTLGRMTALAVQREAYELGLHVTPIVESMRGGLLTFLVVPDGGVDGGEFRYHLFMKPGEVALLRENRSLRSVNEIDPFSPSLNSVGLSETLGARFSDEDASKNRGLA